MTKVKMDYARKVGTNAVNKNHFPKLHERIQNKYNEMQKKIEKSKSIDMLNALNENFTFKEHKRRFSTDNIHNGKQGNNIVNNMTLKTETMSVENMQKMTALYQDVQFNEVVVTDIETIDEHKEHKVDSENEDLSESLFLNDTNPFSKTSMESLLDIGRESDESMPPPTPVSKSIRDKIGSRITAVKERRNANKERRKEVREKVEKFIFTNTPDLEYDRVLKRRKFATVSIAVIEASVLEKDTPDDKWRFLCCRLRLGTEKRKTKSYKFSNPVVKFQELINMNMSDETLLEMSLWDRDIFIGKHVLDLSQLEYEQTHRITIKLEGESLQAPSTNFQLFCLLTISGTDQINTIVDLDDYKKLQQKIDVERRNFAWHKWRKFTDVGWLSVIVFGAKGLASSDCCCILKLNNVRLFTHTEYKTQMPNWMKMFSFTITDITSVLEVTVWDEKRSEEVGKVSIPLLKINSSCKKWYALKGINQRERARGNNPRILLEMGIMWNLLRASVRVVHPKEVDLLQTDEKLDRQTFARNITRAKAIISWIMNAFQAFKTMFEWESMKSNLLALTIWLLFCCFFKTWMLPLLLLIPFAWYNPSKHSVLSVRKKLQQNHMESDDTYKQEKEEKNLTIRQRINSLQDMVQTVQRVIGQFASLGESVKNLFNFSVPFLSCLAIFFILVIALIMYFVPLNYILMAWGIHKFMRKFLKPNRVPNNELLDLLSRVPDDETLLTCEEFTLANLSDEDELL